MPKNVLERAAQAPPCAAPGADLPLELCQHLGFMLAKAFQRMHDALAQVTAPHALMPRHFGMLVLLSQRGPLRQTVLGELMRMDRTTVTHVVDELEAKALVVRERDPQDRRANAVGITALGLEWLVALKPVFAGQEAAFLAPLSTTEREQLRSLLMRLVSGRNDTSAAPPGSGPPETSP